jgi:SulP family sulfate permease
MAALIVGIVALPLAIAFAIASGVSPEKGLFTAIIGGFVNDGQPQRDFNYCCI